MTNQFKKKVIDIKKFIDYQENSIVSKVFAEKENTSLTLFAFDKDQVIATHTAPVDAVVQILEGSLKITISDENFTLKEGEIIIMPKNEPHGLKAITPTKMLLFKV